MLYAFFWVITLRLDFICRRFGTLSLFHLHRQVGFYSHLPAYKDGTECSETSAYKLQTPGYYPNESIQFFFYKHPDLPQGPPNLQYNENKIIFRNVGKYFAVDMTYHPRTYHGDAIQNLHVRCFSTLCRQLYKKRL